MKYSNSLINNIITFIICFLSLFNNTMIFGQSYTHPTCGMVDDATASQNNRSNCELDADDIINNHKAEIIPLTGGSIILPVNFVIVQDPDGNNNFDLNNQDQMAFLNNVINKMNGRMTNLVDEPCDCTDNPTHIENSRISFDVNIIAMRSSIWDHSIQDPSPRFNLSCPLSSSHYVARLFEEFVAHPQFSEAITVFFTNGSSGGGQYNGWWYSGTRCETDPSHAALIHAPTGYEGYLWSAQGNGSIPELENYHARTHTHEIFHQFQIGVGHKHSCALNIMNGSSQVGPAPDPQNPATAITGCQLRQAYGTMMAHHMSKYVPCIESFEQEIEISNDEIWDTQTKIFSNIRVKSGGKLNILCKLEFFDQSKIFVDQGGKLIIDGAHLTSCDKWAGIKVAGGNSDFDIEVKNGAIIENTSEAAITMWPTSSSDPGNGIARIENATFNSVRGAVGFFARTPNNNNPSYIRNCIINDARWGVSNNNCQNIEVSGNTFNNVELECIFGSMGSYQIFNNTFNSGEQDILFMNTSPSLSSLIENNTFNGRNTGYHADGAVFAQNFLLLNQFYNGQIDILNDGHNSFRAWHNMSHAGLGGVSFSNGDRPGEYAFNSFNNNFIAQLPVGDNPGFNFYENCYSSSFTDVYIDGSVAPVIQQGFGDAANNCFTHQGNSSLVFDLGGNPAPFTYVEPNDHNVDCRDAINAHSNVVIDKTGTPGPTPECFDAYTTPPTVPFSPCNPQEGQEEAAKQWLLNKISEIENNPNLTDDQKDKLLSIYRNCLKKVIGRLAEILIEAGDYNGARALYQPESTDDDKVMVYGLYIVEGDIVSANNYLNGLSSESVHLMDFKTVQQSNLQRILSGYTYEPSTTELATIRTIAEKDHPYAAYAKALFYAYTGEVIVSQMPQFVQQELSNRSKKQFDNDKIVTINPNPFREQLNITLEGLDDPQIYIYDILGNTQSITITADYTTINTSNWSDGVYVVKVYDGSELVKTQKVVLVK